MFLLLFFLLPINGSNYLTTYLNPPTANCSALNSQTFVLNFETDDAGNALVAGTTDVAATQPYANLFEMGSGVTFSTDDPTNRPLNIYDSEGDSGQDPDLERNEEGTGLWAGGNLTNEQLFNLLIVNRNANIAVPNDNASGGEITLSSDRMLTAFSFSFVDLDGGRVASSSIVFTNTLTNETATIGFADLEDGSGSVHSTPNVEFGDRHGNQVNSVTASDLGISEFNQVVFIQSGSGGIGSIILQTSTPVCSSAICLPIEVNVNRTGN